MISSLLILSLAASCGSQEKEYVTSTEGVFSYENATVYFAMTDRFFDGDEENNTAYGRKTVDDLGNTIGTFNGGDIKGMTEKLEEGYFTDLGINAIWITAPYEQIHGYIGGGREGDFAHYGFHGYYALDWTMMDRNIGTVEDFRTFVDTAHEKGIRIIMDVVMNHVGYPNLQDMLDYGYGGEDLPEGYEVEEGGDFFSYTDDVDYEDPAAWENYWGDWVRTDLPGYEKPGETEIDFSLAGLPDVRTDVTEDIGLPPILEQKWSMEDESFDPWILPGTKALRRDLGLAPYEYIIKWLSAWVLEFGIDGFRIDTAKHVEIERWAELEVSVTEALKKYRENNPDKPAASFEDDFFMMGEVWGHGVLKNYYFDHGFDALINFSFQGLKKDGPAFKAQRKESVYKNYAEALNNDESFNVLSYISQHDTVLYPRQKLHEGGTYLLLLPGAVKIFYGDETARPIGEGGSDATQGTRSPMNWEEVDEELLLHFRKLGRFRNRNLSVGAGEHTMISEAPYIYMRDYDKNGLKNTVMIYEGEPGEVDIEVREAFTDGALIRDGYTDEIYTVKDGRILLKVHEMGLALLEEVTEKE